MDLSIRVEKEGGYGEFAPAAAACGPQAQPRRGPLTPRLTQDRAAEPSAEEMRRRRLERFDTKPRAPRAEQAEAEDALGRQMAGLSVGGSRCSSAGAAGGADAAAGGRSKSGFRLRR